MSRPTLALAAPLLAALVLAAACAPHATTAPVAAPTGLPARVDLARALAQHPFAGLLAQYDRDIATLRIAQDATAFREFGSRAAAAGAADALSRAAARVGAVGLAPPAAPLRGSTSALGSGIPASFRQVSLQRLARAHELRAGQLGEREADIAFAFDRAHASRRMLLRLKLRDLAVDAQTRAAYRSELNALDARERSLVAAQRQRDGIVLADFDARLRDRLTADTAALSSDLSKQAQTARTIPQPHATIPPGLLRDDRAASAAAFESAGADVRARFGHLRRKHAAAGDAFAAQIAALVRERNGLRDRMIASIAACARRVAASESLGRVYTGAAPAGARDLTGAVVRNLRAAVGER